MPLKLTIETLVSSAGQTINLTPASVTCLVGSNNAGKSQLLRDIDFMISDSNAQPVTLRAISGSRPSGSVEQARDWLDQEGGLTVQKVMGQPQMWVPVYSERHQQNAQDFQLWFDLQQPNLYLGNAARFFVHRAEAGTLKDYAGGVAYDGQSYNGGLAKLIADGDLEQDLSDLVESTFGTEITLDRVNPPARIRVGGTAIDPPAINRPTKEYSDAVSELKPLDDQGDGMRAFVGIALLVMAGHPSVLLIDEPEAFLHPGQARALGRWLAKQARKLDIQIFIATHDRDIVLGLLESDADDAVNIVRIVRQGAENVLSQLSPRVVQSVWKDPVLRYSNLLQGLFHQRVVICESDADCRFYGAALDDLGSSTGRRAESDEVLFVPSGSKNRVASMISALTKLGVQAMTIVDFDILRNSADIRGIVESVGGTWSPELRGLYTTMIQSDNQSALWAQLKNQGLNGLSNGPAHSAGKELLECLKVLGIHVVPLGEMEQFDRDIGGHGGEWVSEALENNVFKGQAVRDFVEALIARETSLLIP
jgi:ABC-type cobalamin/Fe3+-siderophores transport system ATPase subunit